MLLALLRDLAAVADDGDWANDWAPVGSTHLPAALRPLLAALGQLLAAILGTSPDHHPRTPPNGPPPATILGT